MPLERFMVLANAHYYATRDPLGVAGDFTTAPEVSQMFGELVGLALADLWHRAGRPAAAYVELGPGRGTLAVDALRAMRKAGLAPRVHLVETSPVLRARQRAVLPDATWHDAVGTLPDDMALLVVANEFFDALPVRQWQRTADGWAERLVTHRPDGFTPVAAGVDQALTMLPALHQAPIGSIVEDRPAATALARALGERLAEGGGALLAIDYGHAGGLVGDTLQAVRCHAFADPLAAPGAQDLTAHVDFGALAAAFAAGGARVTGPVEQGQWLVTLGLAQRAAALARAAPDQAEAVAVAYRRLVDPAEMGRLFKVLAAAAPGWPSPAGFG